MFHSKVFLHSVTMVTMSYLCLVTCRRWSSWLHMVSVVMMEIFMSCQAILWMENQEQEILPLMGLIWECQMQLKRGHGKFNEQWSWMEVVMKNSGHEQLVMKKLVRNGCSHKNAGCE